MDEADPRARVAARLLGLVSERTGYPIEMLDMHLDLEADLGIDSIKRVEILGSYRQQFGEIGDSDLERLTTQRTLQQIVDTLASPAPADATPWAAPPVRAEAALLAEPYASDEAGAPGEAGVSDELPYPLLGSVVSHEPGQQLVTRRRFDLAEDLYLRDHTLGHAVSDFDPELQALAVMPLAMSLEILAEAAAALLPGRTVVALRDVRANRWLAWDDRPQTLQVTARRLPIGEQVAVQIRNLTEDERSDHPSTSPAVEAVVHLAENFPESPPAQAIVLAGCASVSLGC